MPRLRLEPGVRMMAEDVLVYIPFKYAAVSVYRDHVRTVFYDGSETRGYPPDTEAFRESAAKLGYFLPTFDRGLKKGASPIRTGTSDVIDTYWHMVEHDILHTYVAQALDNAPSAALWNQAHDQNAYKKKPPQCVVDEEWRLGAIQATLNGVRWGIERLKELNVDYDIVLNANASLRNPEMSSAWARTAKPICVLPLGWEQEMGRKDGSE
jgi:hypothetical protein